MRHDRLHSISLKGVAVGFPSLLVGAIIIALFGYRYRQIDWPGGTINQVAGVTPMFWVGVAVIMFGIVCIVSGMILFVISHPNQSDMASVDS